MIAALSQCAQEFNRSEYIPRVENHRLTALQIWGEQLSHYLMAESRHDDQNVVCIFKGFFNVGRCFCDTAESLFASSDFQSAARRDIGQIVREFGAFVQTYVMSGHSCVSRVSTPCVASSYNCNFAHCYNSLLIAKIRI